MKKDIFSTAEILIGIRKGDNQVLRFVYDSYYESVRKMVKQRTGSDDLAQDIFQEALVVIYKKSQNDEFSIEQSSFFTYFYAICKIGIKNYFKNSEKDIIYQSVDYNDDYDINAELEDEELMFQEGIKEQLFHKYIKQISKNCLKLLRLVIKGYRSAEIAKKLNLSWDTYVRKRKKICLESLIEMIKKDPKSNELL